MNGHTECLSVEKSTGKKWFKSKNNGNDQEINQSKSTAFSLLLKE